MEGVQSKPLSLFHYSLVHSLPPSRPPSLYRALSHSFLIYIILYACTVYMYFPPSLPLSVCFLVYNIHDNVHVHVHYVSTRTCTCILSPPPPPPPSPPPLKVGEVIQAVLYPSSLFHVRVSVVMAMVGVPRLLSP